MTGPFSNVIQLLEKRLKTLQRSCCPNKKKNEAYESLLEKFRNATSEQSQEDIFRKWEHALNSEEQHSMRTAMVSHRGMFYLRNSHVLTSSEITIREIRGGMFPGSQNNKREEIIHRLIHRIAALPSTVKEEETAEDLSQSFRSDDATRVTNLAAVERAMLEVLLGTIQIMPLNSTAEAYRDKIVEWESTS
jgi:hypothetical protein